MLWALGVAQGSAANGLQYAAHSEETKRLYMQRYLCEECRSNLAGAPNLFNPFAVKVLSDNDGIDGVCQIYCAIAIRRTHSAGLMDTATELKKGHQIQIYI